MFSRTKSATALLSLLIILLLSSVSLSQGDVRARFIHVAPHLPTLDLYLNGELAAKDLSFGDSSSHFSIPAGSAEVTLRLADEPNTAYSERVSMASDAAIVLTPGDPAQIAIIADDLGELEFGRSRLSVYNAYADGIILGTFTAPDQPTIGEALAFRASVGPLDIAADMLDLAFVPATGTVDRTVFEYAAALSAGTSNVVVVYDRADDPEILIASAPTDAANSSGLVRFVHAVQGAAPFDLRIDDQLIVPALAFATASQHIPIPAGAKRLTLSLGTAKLAAMNLNLSAGQMQTVAVLGSPGSLSVVAFDDDPRGLDEFSPVVRLINAIPDGFLDSLHLNGGIIVASDLAFGEASDSLSIDSGGQSMTLVLTIGEETGTIDVPAHHFYGGAFYNLIALSGGTFSAPRLMITETSIARQISAMMSDPAMNQDPAAAETLSDEAVKTESGSASSAEVTAEPADLVLTPTESSQDIAAPDESAGHDATDMSLEPVSGYRGISPHALVNLDPDANLQIRQYPTSQAFSLGLLPGGSEMMVLGRRGPSEYYDGEQPDEPVDLSDMTVDPAAGLHPAVDLPPEDTWLHVMYETTDGGAVYGWVNAFYLQVFDAVGDIQRLRSLALVRQNHAGSAQNTALSPPELSDLVSARVSGLDPGALLNIRTANDASSEILGHLPPDTLLKLIGLDESEGWALVEYEAAQTITRGWVSTHYLQLFLNDSPVSVATLRSLDASTAPTISNLARGSVRIRDTVAATAVPTPFDMMEGIVGEINLDPGAKLHLRRSPDATSESLALIDAGVLISIHGVTQNGDWLKTAYLEQDGWIASQYVLLLLRSRIYPRSYILSLLTVYDDLGIRMIAGA